MTERKVMTVNDKFEFERDKYCWQLHEWRDGKDKDGNVKRQKRTTYHSTLDQIADAIIDRSAGECQSLSELKGFLSGAKLALTKHIKEIEKCTTP